MEEDWRLCKYWNDAGVFFVSTMFFGRNSQNVFPNLRHIYIFQCDQPHCSKCLSLQKEEVYKPERFPMLLAVYYVNTPWNFEPDLQSDKMTVFRLLQYNRKKLKAVVVAYLSIQNVYNYIDVNIIKIICNLVIKHE
jgi:hypothetical protein